MASQRLWFNGKLLNQRTINMLNAAEDRLGYSLHVMQGSYHTGVSASAGTHNGGGALDVSATSNPAHVVGVLRGVGFAAWHRVPSQGPWTEHIHGIAIGDSDLSSGARTQVREYFARQNGLANHARDDGPHLSPIPVWPVALKRINLKNVQAAFTSKNEYPRALSGVQRIQHLLNKKLGMRLIEDGVAGLKTRQAYKVWEKKLNPSWVTGVPGPKNLQVLADGYYKVV